MWRAALLFTFGCLLFDRVTSQGRAESLPFYGHMPLENIRAKAPVADKGPNDIYPRKPSYLPELKETQLVIYPRPFGYEYGQDPENKVYGVVDAEEFIAKKKQSKHHHKKHDHTHDHNHKHSHDLHSPEQRQPAPQESRSEPSSVSSYDYRPPSEPQKPLPHPSYPHPPRQFKKAPTKPRQSYSSKKAGVHSFFSI